MNIKHEFSNDNLKGGKFLFGKFRYNIQHENTDLRWRLFVKKGDEKEMMYLVTAINCYVPFKTHAEWIDGVGHYSILAAANRIVIDDALVGWIT